MLGRENPAGEVKGCQRVEASLDPARHAVGGQTHVEKPQSMNPGNHAKSPNAANQLGHPKCTHLLTAGLYTSIFHSSIIVYYSFSLKNNQRYFLRRGIVSAKTHTRWRRTYYYIS